MVHTFFLFFIINYAYGTWEHRLNYVLVFFFILDSFRAILVAFCL